MALGTHAWIDESIHADGPGPGFYILAAAIGHPDDAEQVRETLRALVFTGQERLHWRDESPKRRRQITDLIVTIDLDHVIVTAPAQAKRQERARRKCLERLLFELDQTGVTRARIESRQTIQDRRDQEMVEALRGARAIRRSLTADFTKPLEEPMLWIPDATAGMTLAALRDDDHTWLDRLNGSYRLITI